MHHQESKQLAPGYLVLLTVLSYGLYSIYWFYQNWKHLEAIQGRRLRPALRTVGLLIPLVDIFLMAQQWKQIHTITRDQKTFFPLAWTLLGYLLVCYLYGAYAILLTISYFTDTPPTGADLAGGMYVDLIVFTLLGLLMTIPQRALNSYWSHHESTSTSSTHLTSGQIAWITLGGLAWAITALQPFFVQIM